MSDDKPHAIFLHLGSGKITKAVAQDNGTVKEYEIKTVYLPVSKEIMDYNPEVIEWIVKDLTEAAEQDGVALTVVLTNYKGDVYE